MDKQKIFSQILIIFLVLAIGYALNRFGFFEYVLNLIESFGNWAPFIFVGTFALACVFFFPAFIFGCAGGILFGLVKGTLLNLVGLGIGSVLAFLIGRYVARDWLIKVFMENKEFHLLDDAVKVKGWKIVSLARLSPIFPFTIGNYAFGTTRISALHYGVASVIGSIPSMTLYSYVGTLTGSLASLDVVGRDRTVAEWIFFTAGLFATIILTWYLKRVATTAIQNTKQSSKDVAFDEDEVASSGLGNSSTSVEKQDKELL